MQIVSCISQAPKITATRPLSSSERWTPYSLSNPASAARWCAPGVGTVWRTLPAGYYQYRWQTNCDLTPGRGGYKADHITPVHHKTNISQLTKMVYQTFDRLTQLSVSLMRIPQWIGNPQHGKSSAINSGSSGGTGWSARRCQWRPISCAT